jgi:signal transduction histidine kinase
MTLKKQIYFSNVRVVLVTLITFVLIPLAVRLGIYLLAEAGFIENPALSPHRQRPAGSFLFIFLVLFTVVISVVNNLLTYRLIKNIARPLEILSEGIGQIQKYNLAYRIDYQSDDEFRPVCDTFNQMTAYLEAAAIQKQKDEASRRELIAGISHDLRTPLTSIKGYLEGLESGVASTPDMKEKYFATIKNKTSDLEHIIEQLFLFSKLDMDEFPLALRNVALIPVVEDMIEEMSKEYTPRGLDIHFAKEDGTADVEGSVVLADTLWLRNVIVNILENSIAYKTKDRARIEISAAPEKNVPYSDSAADCIALRFADDGPGVAPDAIEKLFSAFYRSDPSRDKKGSGLGLAISAKVIERMGGSCRAELPAGGGLAVVITLPVLRGETP